MSVNYFLSRFFLRASVVKRTKEEKKRQLSYGTHYQMILEQFQLMNLSKTQTES